MKNIYEYISKSGIKITNKHNIRFYIEPIEPVQIIYMGYKSDFVYKSYDSVHWSVVKHQEYIDDIGHRVYIYVDTSQEGADNIRYKGKFNIGGNIFGLTRKEFSNNEQPNSYEFARAFDASDVVDASRLIIDVSCYEKCIFANMFDGCKYLVNPPDLSNIKSLSDSCCAGMFSNCTHLKITPKLPKCELAPECFATMFLGCTNLKEMSDLPYIELKPGCYHSMFSYCGNLKVKDLPAKYVPEDAYLNMFAYSDIKDTPKILAEGVDYYALYGMFRGCKNISEIHINIKTIPSEGGSFGGWLSEAARKGIIYKRPELYLSSGPSGIPKGWTVVDI